MRSLFSWFIRQWKLLLVIAAGLLILFVPFHFPSSAPRDIHIRVEASMFQFSPPTIQVNPGDRVTVELVSTDVVHGFSLDGYNFHLEADPGQSTSGTFIASQAGSFRFRCSVACGNLHPFMMGKFQVGPNLLLIRGGLLLLLGALSGFWLLPRPANARPA